MYGNICMLYVYVLLPWFTLLFKNILFYMVELKCNLYLRIIRKHQKMYLLIIFIKSIKKYTYRTIKLFLIKMSIRKKFKVSYGNFLKDSAL